ncbi:MAG TPA: hypothetical protein VEL31_01785, partial [Ktedonobacteraceae bacterium]|nr:hypothetical protein [Ktedonobacteraceae bacterium]
LFMLLLLPTKMGCYVGKKAVKGPGRIVYGTIYDQQKARMSLFHNPDAWTVLLGHMHRQPLGEIGYRSFSHAIGRYAS